MEVADYESKRIQRLIIKITIDGSARYKVWHFRFLYIESIRKNAAIFQIVAKNQRYKYNKASDGDNNAVWQRFVKCGMTKTPTIISIVENTDDI